MTTPERDLSHDKSSPVESVLVVLHEEILGGASLSILRLLPILEQRGWRFAFWAPAADGEDSAAAWLEARGYPVAGAERTVFTSIRGLRLDPGPRRRLALLGPYARALRAYVAEIDPDLIHLNGLSSLAEAIMVRSLGRPAVLHVHEMLPSGAKGRLASRIARLLADELVTVSEASAARLSARGFRPRVVHESAPIPAAPRTELAAPGLRFGSVGVISRRKGSDIFVEAAGLVRAERPDVSFELIGAPTDPLDAEWARGVLGKAADLGIAHVLRADVGAAMASWDVFALPSRRDPFPIAMLEAMGLGLACVGARADGIVEQLGEGAGVLVEPDSPAALAAAILRLADDEGLRRQLGAAARARVLERHAPELQADGIEAAWRAAPAGARRRG